MHHNVDIFDIKVPEGVWQLCWGMKKRACLKEPFIDPKFTPIGSPDANEYEGLPPDPVDTIEEPYIRANSIKVRISIPSSFQQPPMPENAPAPQITDDHLDVDCTANTALPTGQKLMIQLPARGHIAGMEGTVECEVIRTFCPSELCEMIVDMMTHSYQATRTQVHKGSKSGLSNRYMTSVLNMIFVKHGLTCGKTGIAWTGGNSGHGLSMKTCHV